MSRLIDTNERSMVCLRRRRRNILNMMRLLSSRLTVLRFTLAIIIQENNNLSQETENDEVRSQLTTNQNKQVLEAGS